VIVRLVELMGLRVLRCKMTEVYRSSIAIGHVLGDWYRSDRDALHNNIVWHARIRRVHQAHTSVTSSINASWTIN
jgi:iron-sulfur cluster repair protein YtfE (RIC family)